MMGCGMARRVSPRNSFDAVLPALHRALFTSVSNRPLIPFRILFGGVMAAEALGSIFTGWVKETWMDVPRNFPFIGFEVLHALHGEWMYGYYWGLAVCSILVLLGLFYRPASLVMALLWTGTYLGQKTHYNNHYYLMVLLVWAMAILPAHRRWSLDVRRGAVTEETTWPAWQHWAFIFQIACVYFFAALAKVNADWLRAMPLKLWLPYKKDIWLLQPLVANQVSPWVLSYGGLFFDLLIVPALMWRKTRVPAFILSCIFHLSNSIIFQIGTFPYLALALYIFFFPPPRYAAAAPVVEGEERGRVVWTSAQRRTLSLLAVFCALQILLPLRHWLIPGDVNWTEEGHRMSWRMMLRSKSGAVNFRVEDKAGEGLWIVHPAQYYGPSQLTDIATHPDMAWQAAQTIREDFRRRGHDVRVFAEGWCSLNGGRHLPLYDSSADLAATRWQWWGHRPWVLLH